ncbi:MAG TPA: hypothetical protein VME42_20580 [Steroidobacteraceae bacterium]|nr:hypothetical protein [Steroidobacteraceae bacterium]
MFRLFKLWRMARNDLPLLWFALRQPDRPFWLIPATVVLLLYALDPLNLALPLAGALDELVIVPLALHLLVRLLPGHLRGALSRA